MEHSCQNLMHVIKVIKRLKDANEPNMHSWYLFKRAPYPPFWSMNIYICQIGCFCSVLNDQLSILDVKVSGFKTQPQLTLMSCSDNWAFSFIIN